MTEQELSRLSRAVEDRTDETETEEETSMTERTTKDEEVPVLTGPTRSLAQERLDALTTEVEALLRSLGDRHMMLADLRRQVAELERQVALEEERFRVLRGAFNELSGVAR